MAIVALNPGVINTDMLTSCFGSSSSLYQTPESWYVFQFFTCTNFLLGIVIFICSRKQYCFITICITGRNSRWLY